MKLFKYVPHAVALLALSACTYSPLLDATYVSHVKRNIDPSKGIELGRVTLEDSVCIGENGLGIMGTAVKVALAQKPGATYMKDASFTHQGKCVKVTGIAYKDQEPES